MGPQPWDPMGTHGAAGPNHPYALRFLWLCMCAVPWCCHMLSDARSGTDLVRFCAWVGRAPRRGFVLGVVGYTFLFPSSPPFTSTLLSFDFLID